MATGQPKQSRAQAFAIVDGTLEVGLNMNLAIGFRWPKAVAGTPSAGLGDMRHQKWDVARPQGRSVRLACSRKLACGPTYC